MGLNFRAAAKENPGHVIGAGFSEAQLRFMTFCQAEEKRSQGLLVPAPPLLLICGWLDCWDC